MRSIIISWLVPLLAVPCAAGAQKPEASASPALRVMTFNIRYGTARDGANRWELRKQHVVTTIREARPHLLGLQEALAFQLAYLRAELPGYASVGVGRGGGERGEFSCIMMTDYDD